MFSKYKVSFKGEGNPIFLSGSGYVPRRECGERTCQLKARKTMKMLIRLFVKYSGNYEVRNKEFGKKIGRPRKCALFSEIGVHHRSVCKVGFR